MNRNSGPSTGQNISAVYTQNLLILQDLVNEIASNVPPSGPPYKRQLQSAILDQWHREVRAFINEEAPKLGIRYPSPREPHFAFPDRFYRGIFLVALSYLAQNSGRDKERPSSENLVSAPSISF
jgi:hypothetical protein